MPNLAQTILPKDKPQIITTRVIAAPRELVWKVLTTPEHLQHFFGGWRRGPVHHARPRWQGLAQSL
jgi:uncharacterized protein YndB with AHSA1/START domain